MGSRREQQVTETFIELADTLASDYEIGEFLHTLVERCAEILRVSTAGVVIESRAGTLRLAAATSDEMEALEDAEIDHGEGPCLDAHRHGEAVSAGDLRDELGRWPNIVPLALDMGLLAVHAFPLRLRQDRIGALNLYRDSTGAFHADDVRLAQAMADVAAIGILQERKVSAAEERADQLQHALDSRVVIEQAKGVLAERAGISPAEAFERIRRHARSNHMTVRATAQAVVENGREALGL